MKLHEYLSLIYPFFSEGEKEHEFLLSYFDNVMSNEDYVTNPLSDVLAEHRTRIFRGNRNLTSDVASYIIQNIDKSRHNEYCLSVCSYDSLEILDKQLHQIGIKNVKNENTPDICLDILIDILLKIARKSDSSIPNIASISDIYTFSVSISDNKLDIKNTALDLVEQLEVPEDFAENELTYIQALFDAYSDDFGKNINRDNINESNIPKTYRINFIEQRKNFYGAESVSRFLRDGYSDSEQHLEKLKDEIYDGVIDIVWDDYDSGFKRLKETLKEVVKISLNGSILKKTPDLIDNKARKGMCHMLVNEERITWVIENE